MAERNTSHETPHNMHAKGYGSGAVHLLSCHPISRMVHPRYLCTCHSTSGSTSRRVFLVQTEQEFMNEDGIDSDQKLEPLKFRLGEVKIIDVPKFMRLTKH